MFQLTGTTTYWNIANDLQWKAQNKRKKNYTLLTKKTIPDLLELPNGILLKSTVSPFFNAHLKYDQFRTTTDVVYSVYNWYTQFIFHMILMLILLHVFWIKCFSSFELQQISFDFEIDPKFQLKHQYID